MSVNRYMEKCFVGVFYMVEIKKIINHVYLLGIIKFCYRNRKFVFKNVLIFLTDLKKGGGSQSLDLGCLK